MMFSSDYKNAYVQTPKGKGYVVAVRADIKNLTNYVRVELDHDKGLYEFPDYDVTVITLDNDSQELKKTNKQSLVKDSDVIKALECCQLSNTHQAEDCDNCPFNELPQTICQNLLAYHALQIIKRGTR